MTEVMLFRRRKSVAARRVVVIPRRDTRPGILLFIIRSRSLVVEYLQILGSMRNQVKAKREVSTTREIPQILIEIQMEPPVFRKELN